MANDNPFAPAAMSSISLSTAGRGPQPSVRGLLESRVNDLQMRRSDLLNQADAYLETVSRRTLDSSQSTTPAAALQPVSSDRFRLSGNVIGDEANNPPPMAGMRVRIVDASGTIVENPAWQTDPTGRFNLDVSKSELARGDGSFTLELADAQGNRVQSIDVPVQFGRSITVELRVPVAAGSSLEAHARLGVNTAESVAQTAAQLEVQKKQITTWRALSMLDLDRRLAASTAALQALAKVQAAANRSATTSAVTRNPFPPP